MKGMFLRNFYNSIMRSIFMNATNTNADLIERETNYLIYDITGKTTTDFYGAMLYLNGLGVGIPTCNSLGNSVYNYSGIVLGGNDTAVTFDDILFTNLGGYNGSVVKKTGPIYNHETGQWEMSFKFTVNNTSATNDLVVKEIGIVQKNSSSSSTVLVYREVLDTPVTIPAGESASLYFDCGFGI